MCIHYSDVYLCCFEHSTIYLTIKNIFEIERRDFLIIIILTYYYMLKYVFVVAFMNHFHPFIIWRCCCSCKCGMQQMSLATCWRSPLTHSSCHLFYCRARIRIWPWSRGRRDVLTINEFHIMAVNLPVCWSMKVPWRAVCQIAFVGQIVNN